MARPKKSTNRTTKQKQSSYLNRLESEISSHPSKLSMVLGALIILVVGILLYSYFNRPNSEIGPSSRTEQTQKQGDVKPENLPGKYTVKEGDTLFDIAQKYYSDGDKFTDIAKANNITDVNYLETGTILNLPKLEVSATPAVAPSASLAQEVNTANDTLWGPAITGTTYTVVEGDWLSKIAGRAYGNIWAYQKLAEVNHISDPNVIEPGTVLTIPR